MALVWKVLVFHWGPPFSYDPSAKATLFNRLDQKRSFDQMHNAHLFFMWSLFLGHFVKFVKLSCSKFSKLRHKYPEVSAKKKKKTKSIGTAWEHYKSSSHIYINHIRFWWRGLYSTPAQSGFPFYQIKYITGHVRGIFFTNSHNLQQALF